MAISRDNHSEALLSFAQKRARSFSRILLNFLLVAVLLLPLMVMTINYYSRTEEVFKGVKENIRYSLLTGDVYLKRQLSSLVSGNSHDFAWLNFKKKKPNGEVRKIFVSRFENKKVKNLSPSLFFISNYTLYWVYQNAISDFKGNVLATLHLARPLPIGSLVIWALLIALFYFFISRYLSSSLQEMAIEMVKPLTGLTLFLRRVRDNPKVFEKPAGLPTKFLEVKMVAKEFKDLWDEKIKSEEMAKTALKDSLKVKTASHLGHDLKTDFFIIRAALKKLEGPDNAFQAIETALMRAKNTVQEFPKVATMEVDEVLNYFQQGRNAENNLVFPLVQEVANEADLWVGQFNPSIKFNVDLFPTQKKALLNPNIFKRALLNFLKNSFEALANSKGQREVTLKLHEDDSSIIVTIQDNGRGMTAHEREKLAKEGFSTKEGGTGLGASSAIATIEKWKGRVDIDSKEGKGTTVKIFLPKNAPCP